MMPFTALATLGDILEDDPELSTFNQLVRRSGVIKQLDSPGTFTVFAPTNAAFDLLPAGALGAVVKDSERLSQAMRHHISPELYSGAALPELRTVPTLYGGALAVVSADEGFAVGGASVEETDIQASNGVLHKVSNVMFPGDR